MGNHLEFGNKTKLLYHWLSKEKAYMYKIYLLAFLQGTLYITIPLSVQAMITYVMAGRFSASLLLLGLVTVVATLFIGIWQLWQLRITETLQQKFFCDLTDRIANYVQSVKVDEVRSKLVHFFEVFVLQKGIGKILLDFSFSIVSIVFGLLILPAYSTWFLIISVVLSIVFYLVVSYYGKKATIANIETSHRKYLLYDTFNILYQDEKKGMEQVNTILDDYLRHRKNYYLTFENQYKGILFFKIFFVSILLFLGAYLVQIGQLNIGQFVTVEIIILLIINSVEKLAMSLGTFYDIITALYKIENIFVKHPEKSFLNSLEPKKIPAATRIYRHPYSKRIKLTMYGLIGLYILSLFLPWTQSVRMSGTVSAINPENKPQQVTSRIAGRVEKWFIKDGDYVKKGDTIAFLSEIKEEYMDSMLVNRSQNLIDVKETSIQSYSNKINAIHAQLDALNKGLYLKTNQAKNKLIQLRAKLSSDSVEAVAAKNNYTVSEDQFKRYEDLLNKGIISRTDYENRKVKVQETYAKKIAAENKIINTKNDLINAEIELNTIRQEYNEKIMKTESEKYSTMSALYDAEGELTKLQNQLSNYSLRNTFYYVLAPQSGYVHNIALKGLGEIVKEGGILCYIVPEQKEQSVELFIDPIDLPLIHQNQNVQLIFDGWPAFVLTGWPGLNFGTYKATIVAVDKSLSGNGKFRVLAVNKDKKWPEAIQIGGGVKGFALLHQVPLFYEIWRKANGFPPEYYSQPKGEQKNEK